MGHTLIAVPKEETLENLKKLLLNTNKIPFGRNCNRIEANHILPYHVTLSHWSHKEDEENLPNMNHLEMTRFSLTVTRSAIVDGREGSYVLCLEMVPGEGFDVIQNRMDTKCNLPVNTWFHMTLAVDQNLGMLKQLQQQIDATMVYPYCMDFDRLELYRIWNPIEKERVFLSESES